MAQYSDEQVLSYLRGFRSRYPEQGVEEFRKSRQTLYPDQHHLIEQVLKEDLRDYQEVPIPRLPPPPAVSYSEYKQSQVNNETSPTHATVETSQPDNAFKSKIKPRRTWKQQYGKRQAKKEARKELIVLWLNDVERWDTGFKVTDIMAHIEGEGVIQERMFRNYLEELFQAKKVKRWRKPVILPGGQHILHHYYAGAHIKSPYYTWVDEE
jgi:hypothetical protein